MQALPPRLASHRNAETPLSYMLNGLFYVSDFVLILCYSRVVCMHLEALLMGSRFSDGMSWISGHIFA